MALMRMSRGQYEQRKVRCSAFALRGNPRVMLRMPAIRRGTALIELVIVIPLLALIISLTFFFGRVYVNKQNLIVGDRYVAWRVVRGGGMLSDGEANPMLFEGLAGGYIVYASGPTEIYDQWVNDAYDTGADAGQVVDDVIADHVPDPISWAVESSSPFYMSEAFWQQFEGNMTDIYVRDGVPWVRDEMHCEEVIRTWFLSELDNALSTVTGDGRQMAQLLRILYMEPW